MNFEPTTNINNISMMECCSNQTTLNPLDFDVGCSNDNDMFFDGEQVNLFLNLLIKFVRKKNPQKNKYYIFEDFQ